NQYPTLEEKEQVKQIIVDYSNPQKELDEKLGLANNNFFGSLEPLAGLNKLKELSIRDTDIDSGLEYLPDSLVTKLPKLNRAKLQEQIKFLEAEKERLTKRIVTLEELTVENQRLIKEQKGKIVNDYLLFTENEEQILQELIEAHKAYFQAKKQKETNVLELRRKYDKLYYKLENENFTRSEKEKSLVNEKLIEEAIVKSKQSLIAEQQNQIRENNLLL
ncbi:3718_t:CDS:2, partial [Funneliformis geosporum]